MSEIYDILSDALDERAPTFGMQITHLKSDTKFFATIEDNLDPFTLPTNLADDPREKIRLHIDQGQPEVLNDTDLIRFTRKGLVCMFSVVGGFYSPASLQNKFLCIQKAKVDQQ